MPAGCDVFVVEEQFLLSVDIQQILEHAGVRRAVFARSASEATRLTRRWPEFHLAVVDLPKDSGEAVALAKTGVAVVLMSFWPFDRKWLAGLEHAPIISKPFSADELIHACRAALSRR